MTSGSIGSMLDGEERGRRWGCGKKTNEEKKIKFRKKLSSTIVFVNRQTTTRMRLTVSIIHLIFFLQSPPTPRSKRKTEGKERTTSQSSLVDTGLLVATIGLEVVRTSEGVLVVGHVSAALETLHLPRLQLAEVLLAGVDAADLVADDVRLDVLLRTCL
jgi:hypothetical protein